MHRIDTSTATSDGLFTEGDPLVPTPATVVSADWLNSVQEELATIVTNAGLELQKADNTQVLTAILQIIARQSSELERLRLLKIGCPMYWRSTTLPENFAWVNGDLILFEDRPEFEEVYLAGGFEGMLLEANATSEQIAANLGKFRKHPNGLGLYLPSCGEQFFRAWTLGAGEAGVNLVDTGRTLTASWTTGWAQSFIPTVYTGGAVYAETSTATQASVTATDPVIQPFHVVFDAARVWGEHAATEFSPAHVRLPVILYLGLST
nr:MAG TPA: tail fiber protein [Caudoviricetes sp.]